MTTYALPRFLFVGLVFCLIATGMFHDKVAASAGTITWSDTVAGEDEFVQACTGFDIITSYTTKLTLHAVENHSGDHVVSRLQVSFVGILSNDKNGYSLPYDGKFTRMSYDHIGRVTISDLELRIQLPTPGDFMIKVPAAEMDLSSNPVDVIHAFAHSELESGICVLLGRTFTGSVRATGQAKNVDMLQEPFGHQIEATDAMTPWTELDPCDTSPPAQLC